MPDRAVKHDDEKPRVDLISPAALLGLAEVLTYGAAKYTDHNWRRGMRHTRYFAAAMRHLLAWLDGEDLDPESGLPHVDHAACCLMFLSEAQKRGHGTDDRWRPGESAPPSDRTADARQQQMAENLAREIAKLEGTDL